jgi:hypothetical protein
MGYLAIRFITTLKDVKMDYKILISTSPGWSDKPIEANLTTHIDVFGFSKTILSSEKIKDVPNLVFDINQEINLPDFISSGVFWLFSDRLLEILKRYSFSFESFPVTLEGERTILKNYHLFHLLEVKPIVNLEKSKIQSRTNVEHIELYDFFEINPPAMVRDSFLLSLVFVREDVVHAIQSEKILGCEWMEPADYKFVLNRKRW